MTERAPSAWPYAAWMMLGFASVALSVAVLGGILSPSLVLDLVSLWPLGALGVLSLAVAVPLRRRRHRLLALPPLLLLTWILLGGALHLARWDPLPSASAGVEGPPSGEVEEAVLEVVQEEGRLEVTAGEHLLYSVRPIPAGGPTGPPSVRQATGDGGARITAVERRDSRWFRFAGWEVEVDPTVGWSLLVESPSARVDLQELTVASLAVSGAGQVELGLPQGPVAVAVEGAWVIDVPSEAPMRVIGPAGVPEGWLESEEGAVAPVGGEGFVVTVGEGASLEVRAR